MSRAEAGWAARAAARRCGVSGPSRRARSSCRCARGVLGTGRYAHMLCCGPRCTLRVRSSHVWRACGQC
eukprot:4608753-Prymnesium_polylepis.1